MKKSIITIILALASCIAATAQSTNPLNYGGKMYVESIISSPLRATSPMKTTPSFQKI